MWYCNYCRLFVNLRAFWDRIEATQNKMELHLIQLQPAAAFHAPPSPHKPSKTEVCCYESLHQEMVLLSRQSALLQAGPFPLFPAWWWCSVPCSNPAADEAGGGMYVCPLFAPAAPHISSVPQHDWYGTRAPTFLMLLVVLRRDGSTCWFLPKGIFPTRGDYALFTGTDLLCQIPVIQRIIGLTLRTSADVAPLGWSIPENRSIELNMRAKLMFDKE